MVNRWLLLWESALTAFSTVSASLGLTTILPAKTAAFMVILAQGLNMGTIVYKTGQWNAQTSTPNPVHLTVQAAPPPGTRPVP